MCHSLIAQGRVWTSLASPGCLQQTSITILSSPILKNRLIRDDDIVSLMYMCYLQQLSRELLVMGCFPLPIQAGDSGEHYGDAIHDHARNLDSFC